MSNVIKEIVIGNKILRITEDTCPPHPRKDFDNLGSLVSWHSGYKLGVQPELSPQEFLNELAVEADPGLEKRINAEHEKAELITEEQRKVWARREQAMYDDVLKKYYVVLPVYLYDHSGITISTAPFSCPWDSGQIGYIYMSMEDARKNWCKRGRSLAKVWEMAEACLVGEIEVYDKFLRNEVYEFEVLEGLPCPACGHHDPETIESCGGFFGSDWKTNGMLEQVPEEFRELLSKDA